MALPIRLFRPDVDSSRSLFVYMCITPFHLPDPLASDISQALSLPLWTWPMMGLARSRVPDPDLVGGYVLQLVALAGELVFDPYLSFSPVPVYMAPGIRRHPKSRPKETAAVVLKLHEPSPFFLIPRLLLVGMCVQLTQHRKV